MIERVAIKMEDGRLYVGKPKERHHHLLNNKDRPIGVLKLGEQGFVDENGKFYNRQEAAKHAFDCKQISIEKSTLFSEDLW